MTVRAAAFLLPIGASFLAALLTQRVFDQLFPTAPWLAGAVVSLIAAMVTLVVGERIGRRFLPLAMLLKLALLFPDQVPSRLAISLRAASPRRLAKKLESADADEATAAERVLALVSALSAHDRLTRGHSERVRAVTMLIADEMGITGVERDKLEWAALLHDVGKITVSPAILNKRGAPNDEEWLELRTHPGNGAPLAGDLAAWMGETIHAIDQHHERFDGSGYPLGLKGNQITQAARIVAAADAFEVMTAVRSYKKAMPVSEARAELAACKGTHFDPIVVRSVASVSLAKLHRALGPASWAMSLPFRGVVAQAIKGAGALVGGSAPTALAGLTAAVAISLATTSMADAVDGRFVTRQEDAVVQTASAEAGAAAATPAATDPSGTADPTSGVDPSNAAASPSNTSEPAGTGEPTSSDDATEGAEDADPSADGETDDDRGSRGTTSTPGTFDALDVLETPVGVPLSIDLSVLNEKERAVIGDALGLDLVDLTEDQLDAAQKLVDDTVTNTSALVDSTLAGAGELVDTTLDTTTGLVDSTVDSATDLVDTAVKNLTTATTATELVENTVDTVTAATEVIEEAVGETVEAVEIVVAETVETVTATVQETVGTAETVASETVETVTETITPVAETIAETVPQVTVPQVTATVTPVTETVAPVTQPVAPVAPVVQTVEAVAETVETVESVETVETVIEPVAPVIETVTETVGGSGGIGNIGGGSGGGLFGY